MPRTPVIVSGFRDNSYSMPKIKAFVNGRVCCHGQWLNQSIYVDEDTGLIIRQPAEMPGDFVDLEDNVLAPAYVELQTNGCLGEIYRRPP